MKTKFWINLHTWVGAVVSLPLLLTTLTGVLLILRSHLSFIQPPTIKLSQANIQEVLPVSQAINRLPKKKWSSIILKPSKGIYSFRSSDGFEFVMDAKNGELVNQGPKRTSLLIRLHEGSFFSPKVRDFIFFPSALGLFFLLVSGVYLFFKRRIKQ